MAGRLTLVVGSKNPHKSEEIRRMLAGLPVEVVGLSDFGDVPDVIEEGVTLEENAAHKALFFARQTGCLVVSDDSGIEVDAIGGAPGVHSARYAGDDATYDDNNRLLLSELAGVPGPKRTARFRCVIALASPDGVVFTTEGAVEGRITAEPHGANGFGYDPVFYVDECGGTFAECPPEAKDAVSHRARALAAFKRRFAEYLAGLPL